MTQPDIQPEICDYEGSNYRTDFWEGRGRNYEDRVERVALRRLLPESGRRLLELGAGFGRLSTAYDMYEQVVLLDYSFSQLQYAREQLGASGRYIYVAADAYRLPFRPGVFDGATMIRTVHHFADVPAFLAGLRHVLGPNSHFILEYANKRNFKAMVRYALRQQDWSPYTHEPVEFVRLNFDFHPAYVTKQLATAGFTLRRRLPVSFFRVGALKRIVPTGLLVGADSLLQHSGLLYTPSIFIAAETTGGSADNNDVHLDDPDSLFAAPGTGTALRRDGDLMICTETGQQWAIRDGIYDFKAPVD